MVQVDIRVSRVTTERSTSASISASSSTVGGDPAYIIELEYAAASPCSTCRPILEMLAMVEAPRLLFPFVRVIVANVSARAAIPP